jgi:hypothetical protein
MNNEPQVTQSHNDKAAKETYRTPGFFIYGTIREVTQAVDDMGNMDGGSGMTDKT